MIFMDKITGELYELVLVRAESGGAIIGFQGDSDESFSQEQVVERFEFVGFL